jgi:hypothetical protein
MGVAAALAAGGAQQKGQENQAGQNEEQVQPVISLEFPGGPLADFVEAVRKSGKDVNVLLMTPEAGKISLPPVRLKSVSVDAALAVLHNCEFRWDDTTVALDVEPFGPRSQGAVYRITANRIDRKSGGPTEVHVWTVADLLIKGLTAEEILTAVETAIELYGGKSPAAQIRFHEATGLLVGSGTGDQLAAIDRVVRELREGVERVGQAAAQVGLEFCKAATAGLRRMMEFGAQQEGRKDKLETATKEIESLKNTLAEKNLELQALRNQYEIAVKNSERLALELSYLQRNKGGGKE